MEATALCFLFLHLGEKWDVELNFTNCFWKMEMHSLYRKQVPSNSARILAIFVA